MVSRAERLPTHVQQNLSYHLADLEDAKKLQALPSGKLFPTPSNDALSDLLQVELLIIIWQQIILLGERSKPGRIGCRFLHERGCKWARPIFREVAPCRSAHLHRANEKG